MRLIHRRHWSWLYALVCATVVSLGCFGQTSSAAPAASGASINIGVEGPMTGIYADVGAGFWRGAQAAAKEINAEGGLLGGRKLVVDQADDVSDPSDAIPAIKKLIDIDHIVGLDGPNSTVLPAIEPILTSHHIPTMFQGGTTTFDTNTNKWIWRPSPSDSQLGVGMAAYALTKHYKRAAVMFSSVASAQTLLGIVKNTYTKNGGTIVDEETIQPGATSYRSEVLNVINSKPDVIFTQVDAPTAAPLFTNMAQLGGGSIPFIGSDLTAGSDFITAITPAVAHKSLTSIQGSTAAGPGAKPFLKYYKKLYNDQPISGANYSYDAIMELSLAIQKSGSTTTSKIDAAVPQVSNPPGKSVSDWAVAVKLLKQGKKIHFVGAGGPAAYNKYHNSLGTFDAFQSDTSGTLHSVKTLGVTTMKKASSGKLKP
jgi:branched-chain amino acid transport system substrate-binding protein